MTSVPADRLYSKVLRSIWRRGSFATLSKLQPSGQALFLYLMTCPEASGLPGAIVAGRLQLAEILEWLPKPFDERFAELASNGLAKADWKARLVWLPAGPRVNKPPNPNVLKSWGGPYRSLPDCPLKGEIYQEFKRLAKGLGERFEEAFREGFGEPFDEQNKNKNKDKEEVIGSFGLTPGQTSRKRSTGQAEKAPKYVSTECKNGKPGPFQLVAHFMLEYHLEYSTDEQWADSWVVAMVDPDTKNLILGIDEVPEWTEAPWVMGRYLGNAKTILNGRSFQQALKLLREWFDNPPSWWDQLGHDLGLLNKVIPKIQLRIKQRKEEKQQEQGELYGRDGQPFDRRPEDRNRFPEEE